ncbi:MAG: hypothetical protein HY043_24235 [Verrucomicrobia bacterium]|nr:hypothetical protein [Verrucomicrobiota bacterium]
MRSPSGKVKDARAPRAAGIASAMLSEHHPAGDGGGEGMKRAMKRHEQMTKAELIRCIKALEQRAPATSIAFEHERLLHEM